MDVSLFDFDLPEGMIARFPPERREEARLMVLRRGGDASPEHRVFSDLPEYFEGREVLVLNDTRVFPARLLGKKETGGRVEALLVEGLDEEDAAVPATRWRAVVGASKPPRPGTRLLFEGGLEAEVESCAAGEAVLRFGLSREAFLEKVEASGRVPLPPYIDRPAEPLDRERYQTVYAARTGAVAAPTAGLHFTPGILAALERKGVEIVRITLHVGPGTFRPVRVNDAREHVMDAEPYEVDAAAARTIGRALAEGRPVTAVGTTSTRVLETLGRRMAPGRGRTGLYILPGHEFGVVGRLVTNFHTPRSTLLMLVSAFAGRERVLAAYREAVARGYRFYSYGDAMLIL